VLTRAGVFGPSNVDVMRDRLQALMNPAAEP
jgi:hypothetical protein